MFKDFLLVCCLIVAGVVFLATAPAPFVQYVFADGTECNEDDPEAPIVYCTNPDAPYCCNGACQECPCE